MQSSTPETMQAVLLTGCGGFDKLEFRSDVAVPAPDYNEVLIRVGAAGVNNTDINMRIGWYSKRVAAEPNEGAANGFETVNADDAGWQGVPLSLPRIQGPDCCGRIVTVGKDVDAARIGQRVIVRPMLRTYVDYRPWECCFLGSDCDGSFAEYVKAPARETYSVACSNQLTKSGLPFTRATISLPRKISSPSDVFPSRSLVVSVTRVWFVPAVFAI